MTFKILSPDEAKKRVKADMAQWKRQKEIDEKKAKLKFERKVEKQTDESRDLKPRDPKAKPSRKKMREDFQEFWKCIKSDDLKGIRNLISLEASVDCRSLSKKTPLIIAAGYGRTGIVELLIANGADVNATDKDGMSAIKCAARQGSMPVVEMLISNGADVKSNGGLIAIVKSTLHLGKVSERLEIIEVLKKHGAVE